MKLSQVATNPHVSDWGLGGGGVDKRISLAPFCTKKAIILPRKARGKHRESTQKSNAFLQASAASVFTGAFCVLISALFVENLKRFVEGASARLRYNICCINSCAVQ